MEALIVCGVACLFLIAMSMNGLLSLLNRYDVRERFSEDRIRLSSNPPASRAEQVRLPTEPSEEHSSFQDVA